MPLSCHQCKHHFKRNQRKENHVWCWHLNLYLPETNHQHRYNYIHRLQYNSKDLLVSRQSCFYHCFFCWVWLPDRYYCKTELSNCTNKNRHYMLMFCRINIACYCLRNNLEYRHEILWMSSPNWGSKFRHPDKTNLENSIRSMWLPTQ